MMEKSFDYITVNKVLFQGSGFVCLQSYENDSSLSMPFSAIKKINLYDRYSHKQTLLTTNVTLTDITVTSFGTIWAIDVLGHLHRLDSRGAGANLNGSNVDDSLDAHVHSLKWSSQGITQQTPMCIIGENDDLWIATKEGGLIHYDGRVFTEHAGIKDPIRFKLLNGCYYLMGYNRQLMQYIDREWKKLSFDASVSPDISINDIAYANGRLLAVSNLGYILYQQIEGILSILHDGRDTPWFGCDTYQDTVYLAGGRCGAYELVINTEPESVDSNKVSTNTCDVVSVKSGHFVAVSVLSHRVVFLQALTASANFVCHIPFEQQRWFLVKT